MAELKSEQHLLEKPFEADPYLKAALDALERGRGLTEQGARVQADAYATITALIERGGNQIDQLQYVFTRQYELSVRSDLKEALRISENETLTPIEAAFAIGRLETFLAALQGQDVPAYSSHGAGPGFISPEEFSRIVRDKCEGYTPESVQAALEKLRSMNVPNTIPIEGVPVEELESRF